MFNAMTFADKQMTRYPKGVKQMFKEDIRFHEVSNAILRYHSGIAHMFYVGIGHYLQYLESQILIKVLLGLKELGIHALPIHDAVVVGRAWVGIISTRETSLEVIASEVFNDTDSVSYTHLTLPTICSV